MAAVLLILLVVELAYIWWAKRRGIADNPCARSSHTRATVSGAGIIFPLGAIAGAFVYTPVYYLFLLGLIMVAWVSFADDLRPQPAWRRFAVQCVAVALIGLYWRAAVAESSHSIFNLQFLAFVIVGAGILNAYNFMDGINGMTAAYSVAVLAPLIYLDYSLHFVPSGLLWISLGAVLIFAFFNFRPRAVCFCGDVGAVSMAYILLFAMMMLAVRTGSFAWLTLMAVYGVDTVATIVRRLMLHERITTAHRRHAYQLLVNELGHSHLAVASLYAGLQAVISAGLIFLPVNQYAYMAVVVALLTCGYVAVVRKVSRSGEKAR